MSEKTIEWFVTQGALGVLALLALAAVVWMVRAREQDKVEREKLHEAHKQEMRSLHLEYKAEAKATGQANQILVERVLTAVDDVVRLGEKWRQ